MIYPVASILLLVVALVSLAVIVETAAHRGESFALPWVTVGAGVLAYLAGGLMVAGVLQ